MIDNGFSRHAAGSVDQGADCSGGAFPPGQLHDRFLTLVRSPDDGRATEHQRVIAGDGEHMRRIRCWRLPSRPRHVSWRSRPVLGSPSQCSLERCPACTWDSVHLTDRPSTSSPGVNPLDPTPGCSECVHVHWAWDTASNIICEGKGVAGCPHITGTHFTNGRPEIVDGSPQTAYLSVVRYSPDADEVDPVLLFLVGGPLGDELDPVCALRLREDHPKEAGQAAGPSD